MPEVSATCQHCRTRPALRRYCRACSPRASIFYKREQRRLAKAIGERYWLEWWVKSYGDDALAKRREHQRLYMRQYRRRRPRGRAHE